MIFKLRKILSLMIIAAVLLIAFTAVASADNAEYLLGDADGDGTVTVIDVTFIQKTLAGIPVNGSFSEKAADVDGSGRVEITDATYIQRWLADLDAPYPIGTLIESPSETPTQMPTDDEGWGREIFRP